MWFPVHQRKIRSFVCCNKLDAHHTLACHHLVLCRYGTVNIELITPRPHVMLYCSCKKIVIHILLYFKTFRTPRKYGLNKTLSIQPYKAKKTSCFPKLEFVHIPKSCTRKTVMIGRLFIRVMFCRLYNVIVDY